MSSRVFAHMVTRNEEHRYLQVVLAALTPHAEAVHIYDDRSTDGTRDLAAEMGALVSTRPTSVSTFMTDESLFRQAAWTDFRRTCGPVLGDWILAIDADELLVAPHGLGELAAATAAGEAVSVVLPIPEVFAINEDGIPLIRTDGWWQHQWLYPAPRLFSFQDSNLFHPQALACGSVPAYATTGVQSREFMGVTLLHLGYLDVDDRTEKFRRYAGRPGHDASHVKSIMTQPRLAAWTDPVSVWRGRR